MAICSFCHLFRLSLPCWSSFFLPSLVLIASLNAQVVSELSSWPVTTQALFAGLDLEEFHEH